MKTIFTLSNQVHRFLTIGFLCFGLSFNQAFAQNTISGTVTDENGEGLPGVSIIVKGTTSGVITDFNGQYNISAESDATLVFSYIGYAPTEQTVGARSVIDLQMELDIEQLSEVVVVGYGTQRKANLTGAVGVISAESLENRPITSASQALQGQTSGVWINQTSGEPGQDQAAIRIRGIGTLNNANPVVFVDGIEAPFDNINPNDIESISVLKDAASASIFGVRAANGVVLVTTKRGKSGKPKFNYSGSTGFSEATNLPGMVTNSAEFMELRNEADANIGQPEFYSQALIDDARANGTNTDWFDEVFKTAAFQQHNLSVSGGGDLANYHVSLGYQDQNSPVRGVDGAERYMGRFNIDAKVNDRVNFGTRLSFTQDTRNLDNIVQDGGVLARSIRQTPNYPARLSDGTGRFAQRGADILAIEFNSPNILAEIESETRDEEDNRFLGNMFVEYEVLDGLKIKGTVGANLGSFRRTYFNRRIDQFDWETNAFVLAENQNRSLENRYARQLIVTSWLQATYEKSFGLNNLKFLAGTSQENEQIEFFQAMRTQVPTNNLAALSTGNPATSTNEGFSGEGTLRSFFFRVNYDFNNRYLLEFNLRRDGSSRFREDERFGTFPSVSAGWVITEEPFFQNNNVIDFLKVRASWGQLGNQTTAILEPIDDPIGQTLADKGNLFLRNYNPAFATIDFSPAYVFGGNISPGAAQITAGNDFIGWETTTQTDIGVNAELLDGRLSFEADYFIRTTDDILFEQAEPGPTGIREPTSRNLAKVQNKGWESLIGWRDDIGDFSYGINVNLTHVTSEVKQIDPALIGDADRVVDPDFPSFILLRGAPVNAIFGLKHIGVFQDQQEIDNAPDQSALIGAPSPGDLRFEDTDGDGVITLDDRRVIGQDNPEWIYGINLNVGYKGFDLSAIFQGIGDAQTYGLGEFYQPFNNSAGLAAYWRDRWTPSNPTNDLPRLATNGGINENVVNSFWIQDRSYMRLKNLQLGYNFPSSVLDNVFLESARIYINAQNLWTVTDFRGFDPEQQERDEDGGQGYPQLKLWTFGVNLTF